MNEDSSFFPSYSLPHAEPAANAGSLHLTDDYGPPPASFLFQPSTAADATTPLMEERRCVQEAISLLPVHLSEDYKTALRRAPGVVATETDPAIFWRCEQGNPWAAAKRCVLHWTLRRQVFGEDRWLRPMNLSGDGAMDGHDIAFLQTGVFALASSSKNTTQQQAMVVNFSRLNGKDPGTSRHRCFMFILYHQLNAYTQQHGLIILMSLPSTGVRVRSDNGKMLQTSHTSQLFWVRGIFLVHDPNDERHMLVRTFAAMIASLVRRVLDRVPHLIVTSDRRETIRQLELVSVDRDIVPEHLGGEWMYQFFDKWVESLCGPVASAPKIQEDYSNFPMIGTSLILQAGREIQESGHLGSQIRPPEHVVRQRNADMARQRYKKRRLEMHSLQAHARDLQRLNTSLQLDNARLEILLERASSHLGKIASEFGIGSERAAH